MTVQVFVSYRRGDSPHAAGRLVDRLDESFKLFIDVDRIRPGADFTSVVRAAVDQSDVLDACCANVTPRTGSVSFGSMLTTCGGA